MGESKRKAQARFQHALESAHEEGQGIWALDVYHSSSIMNIMLGSAAGNKEAANLALVVGTLVKSISRPTLGASKPSLCLTCEAEFTLNSAKPEGSVVIKGAVDCACHYIASLLCENCFHHPDVKARVFNVMRNGLIQDAREVQVSEAGHA